MINLSDEETSNHVDSDIVFKSSTAATTPQDGSLMGSLGPSSIQGSIESVPNIQVITYLVYNHLGKAVW